MQLSDRQQEIIDEFQFFDSWMDKYQYLIDLGHELEPLTEEEKNENNLVRGCQSQVWMVVDGDADHEAEGEQAVDQRLAKLRLGLAEVPVDVQRLRVVGEGAEHHVVHLGDGARQGVVEFHAHFEFFVIETRHCCLSFCCRGARG